MTPPYYTDEAVTLYHADCLDVLRETPDDSVDSVVTDPPYNLSFMGREWDSFGGKGDGRQPGDDNYPEPPDNPFGRSTVRYGVCGTGALNIDACRVGTDGGTAGAGAGPRGDVYGAFGKPVAGLGRWPTNVVLTHTPDCQQVGTRSVKGDSRPGGTGTREPGFGDVRGETDGNGEPVGRLYGDETVAVWDCAPGCPVAELDQQAGTTTSRSGGTTDRRSAGIMGSTVPGVRARTGHDDSGGASRFFPTFRYEAKASSTERPKVDGAGHATVKPLDLMRWLVRLVTPPAGVCLDPFAGSGTTTAEACVIEHFRCITIEREADYLPLIVARLAKPIQMGLDFDAQT